MQCEMHQELKLTTEVPPWYLLTVSRSMPQLWLIGICGKTIRGLMGFHCTEIYNVNQQQHRHPVYEEDS